MVMLLGHNSFFCDLDILVTSCNEEELVYEEDCIYDDDEEGDEKYQIR